MWKKGLVFTFSLVILCGLAYYSGFLLVADESPQNIVEFSSEDEPLENAGEDAVIEQSDKAVEHHPEEMHKAAGSDKVHAETKEEKPEEKIEIEYSYYLVEEFGYVNIYLKDKESLYEYTDIAIDSLPEDLQVEICTGKGVANEQELYDFLENYSS